MICRLFGGLLHIVVNYIVTWFLVGVKYERRAWLDRYFGVVSSTKDVFG